LLIRYSSSESQYGLGFRLFHPFDDLGEAVGHGRQNRLVMLSQQPPDFCSDLLRASCFLKKQNAIPTHGGIPKGVLNTGLFKREHPS
jgi:hypothetical protein